MFQARKHNLACVNVPVKIYKEKCYVCFFSPNLDRVQPCILLTVKCFELKHNLDRVQPCILLTVKCFELKHNLDTFQCHAYC